MKIKDESELIKAMIFLIYAVAFLFVFGTLNQIFQVCNILGLI